MACVDPQAVPGQLDEAPVSGPINLGQFKLIISHFRNVGRGFPSPQYQSAATLRFIDMFRIMLTAYD